MKTYIINVSTNEVRRNHMLKQIGQDPCLNNYVFVHAGDIKDITSAVHAAYFGGELNEIGPAVSCAYKHILAYQNALTVTDQTLFLVLEDDIFLHDGFCARLAAIKAEIERRGLTNLLVSLEESSLTYVNGSERKADQLLYAKRTGRMTGAYLFDKQAAQSLLAEIEANKCKRPFDWFHNECAQSGVIAMYWAHPCLAVQGSLNGKIKSLIDDKSSGSWKVWSFALQRAYKKLLYSLR